MHIEKKDFLIESLDYANIDNIFSNKFDITWAFQDTGINSPPFDDEQLQHKIGERAWDKLPNERVSLDHKDCIDSNIIYKYNNEYYRCDDFTKLHDGIHVLFGGCSETEGVGGALEYTWTKKLYNELNNNNKISGFYSIARGGFGWQKIISNFMVYAKNYGFPDYFFVLLPNLTREYRYDIKSRSYEYAQLYPDHYRIQSNGLYEFENTKDIPASNIYRHGLILLEEYRKSLIDFKISWDLFEKFCESNNTKILWSTYDKIDSKNFDYLNISNNFFKIDESKLELYLSEKVDLSTHKYSFGFRDGHRGELVKEYWAKMFLEEIKKRGMLNYEK